MNDPNSKAIRDSLRNVEEGNSEHLKEVRFLNRLAFAMNAVAVGLMYVYFVKEIFFK